MSFSIELELQSYKTIKLKDGKKAVLRPLKADDEKEFHQLFLDIPEPERMFIKHRVQDIKVIRDWCRNIDVGRNLPLLGVVDGKIGVATLHQRLGGWKRHIGRVSVLVHPISRPRPRDQAHRGNTRRHRPAAPAWTCRQRLSSQNKPPP
jgi:hypothetical protein